MIGVCLKFVARRTEVDPLTGEVATDPRTSGASEADLAALEWALRLGERWGQEVVAVTAGPPEAEVVLRDALAAGAVRAVRVDVAAHAQSEVVAAALAAALDGASAVLCGDWSLDRGSGSVPAFVAAHLGAAQALGLVSITLDDNEPTDADTDAPTDAGGAGPQHRPDLHNADLHNAAVPGADDTASLTVERRLDGGRREVLRVTAPMVLSVEGRLRLRRASIDGMLRARETTIEVVARTLAPSGSGHTEPTVVRPYRPRARALAPPPADLTARERVLALTGALVERPATERLTLDPPEAADRLLDQLRTWGYLDGTEPTP